MTASNLETKQPIPIDLGNAPFEEPWQAQAFGIVVSLNRAGLFTWEEWVQTFSGEIKRAPATPGETANDAYYRQWVAAAEIIVEKKHVVTSGMISDRKDQWYKAYLNTPHGMAVELKNAARAPDPRESHHHHGPGEAVPVMVSPATPRGADRKSGIG